MLANGACFLEDNFTIYASWNRQGATRSTSRYLIGFPSGLLQHLTARLRARLPFSKIPVKDWAIACFEQKNILLVGT